MRKSLLYITLIVTTLISSCSDDLGVNEQLQSDRVGFNVDLNNIAMSNSARSNDSIAQNNVQLKLLNEKLRGDSLFLFTIVEDSISSNIKGVKNNKCQSRGTEITTASITDMGVTGIVYNGADYTDWSTTGSNAKVYMHDEQSTKTASWCTDRYWPETENTRMRFFAYSPYGAVTLSTTTVTPAFEYTIADKVVDQKDLLVASSDVQCPNNYEAAPLTFAHALTAVMFEIANTVEKITVKAVRVKDVYYKGKYQYEYCGINKDDGDDTTPNSDTGSWNVEETEDKKTYEINNLNKQIVGGTSTNIPLNENEYVLMLMPQTLPDGATIEVDVKDDVTGWEGTLKSSIAGNVWEKGKQVTYCISASDEIVQYVFETENVQVPEYYGGEGIFTVKSYKKTTRFGGELIEPVAWDVEDVIDNERNKTAVWMQELKGYKGNGVSNENDWETVRYQMGPAPLQLATSHWQEKRSHTNYHIAQCDEKGKYNDPYDLSTNGGTSSMNTANCYIIGYAGHYKLPLVYGNAINGAYSGSDYVDHTNTPDINNPWITSRYTAASADLVWQDAPGLVTNLRLVNDGEYIAFEIKKEYACDGNAVVAVKDGNGVIMWSWHIWVSHYKSLWEGNTNGCNDEQHINIYNKKFGLLNDAGELITSSNTVPDPFNRKNTYSGNYIVDKLHHGQKFTMLTKYLGYCRGEEKHYGGSVTINFKQAGNENSSLGLDVNSAIKHISTANNAVYYQFGRKDPFVGYGETLDAGVTFQNKTCFGNDGKPVEFKYSSSAAESISETIKNPDVFYGANSDYWLSTSAGIREEFLWQAASYTIPGGNNDSNRWNDIEFWTSSTPVVKTIYDPCPVGYEMPRSDAFTGFLLDTKNPDKQLTGRPEEYKAYFTQNNGDWNSDDYTYVMDLPCSVENTESNNNGNILREPNPCAFVSEYGEFGYWFRPDVNGAGKYSGTDDIFSDGEDEHKIDDIYKNCLLLMAMGCRGGDNTTGGSVKEYRNMGNAMTATLVVENGATEARPSRLYFFHKSTNDNSYINAPIGWYPNGNTNCRGHLSGSEGYPWNTDVSIEKNAALFSSGNQIMTAASSAFSLGFTILPAKSGANGVNID